MKMKNLEKFVEKMVANETNSKEWENRMDDVKEDSYEEFLKDNMAEEQDCQRDELEPGEITEAWLEIEEALEDVEEY